MLKSTDKKGCSKNEVISFLLQPLYIFFLCLLYRYSYKLEQACSICKSIIFKCSYKLEQACSNSKSLTYRPPYKLEQACTNFKKQCI